MIDSHCSPVVESNQTYVGGGSSIVWFSTQLGFSNSPWRVRNVRWNLDHVEILVGGPEAAEFQLTITPLGAKKSAFITTQYLALAHSGKSLPQEIPAVLKDAFEKNLGPLDFNGLLQLLDTDPDKQPLQPPSVASPLGQGQPTGQLDTWGVGDSWADFVAAGEVARARLDSVEPTKLFRFIQHGESECAQVLPKGPGPIVEMVDYPWEDRIRGRGELPYSNLRSGLPTEDEPLITTDLTETDVVAGNPKKLTDILEHAIAKGDSDKRTILFSNTCVPVVVGEDVESVVRRYSEKSPVPLLFLTVTPRSMLNIFNDLLVVRRKQAESAAGVPPKDTINLIGYPESRAVNELIEMLLLFGIKLNIRFIPDISEELIDMLPNAALNVVLPNSMWDNLYEQLLQDSKIPHIKPTAPWGIAGTLAWIRQILEALGHGEPDPSVWNNYVAQFQAQWDEASARCQGQRLGFALRGRDIHVLTDPSNTWGVSLIAQLEEAGFGLDILLLLKDANDAKNRAGQVNAMFTYPQRHVFKGFMSMEMLRQRLADSTAKAFYSVHTFDWRLTEAGKNRFSVQHFELGVPGAIRTMNRLADLCNTTLYQEYRRFFARTEGGNLVHQGWRYR